MTPETSGAPVALACGGTGGHLFPGLAVAHELAGRGARVTLFVSSKTVDQQGAESAADRFEVVALPLMAFSGRSVLSFLRGSWLSYRETRRHFARKPPVAVLAMGGFTSAVPVWAGRQAGALTFLHESNTLPGRANRWLARWVDEGFVGFAESAARLACPRVSVTGTPVRSEIRQADPAAARQVLGLAVERPVLLVTGGSQGARGVNRMVLSALPQLVQEHPGLQFIHLSGTADCSEVEAGYRRAGVPAWVRPFAPRMDSLLAAATVVVSRSGASSLAELAARRLPAVLIPYPLAAEDHQRHNAMAFVRAGAARLLDQATAEGGALVAILGELLGNRRVRADMMDALARLDVPTAATDIADRIWRRVAERRAASFHGVPAPAAERSTRLSARAA